LFKDKHFDQVSEDNMTRYHGTKFYNLLNSADSLAQLFLDMNGLDFNGDGRADR